MSRLDFSVGLGVSRALSKGVVIDRFTAALPAGWTYSRAGPASPYTNAGVIVSVPTDVAAITDRGLLLEPAATNLLTHSNDFANAVWAGVGTRVGGFPAPDGTNTAVEVTMPNMATVLVRALAGAGASGGISTRFYFQTTENSVWSFLVRNNTTAANLNQRDNVNFTASPALTVNGWTVRPLANGWHEVTGIQPTGINNGDAVAIYYGNAGANQNGRKFRIWGGNLFGSTTPTSPIPTTTASVARGLPSLTRAVPAGRTVARVTYGLADAVVDIVGLTPGAMFDAVTGRPWTGLGNELKSIEWRQ